MTVAERPPLRKPDKPFYFNISENLLRIGYEAVEHLCHAAAHGR